jgi:hypothetical protein
MGELVKVIHVLSESQSQHIQLAVDDQLSLLEDMIDTVTSAIKQLHDRKLAIDYLSNVKLYDSINKMTNDESFTLLIKKVSDFFQIKRFYLRQNNDLVIILHVPCTNVLLKFTDICHIL